MLHMCGMGVRVLLDSFSGSFPSEVLASREKNVEDFADDFFLFDDAPIAAIRAAIAVVSEYENVSFWNRRSPGGRHLWSVLAGAPVAPVG